MPVNAKPTSPNAGQIELAPQASEGFRLMRYFMLTSLIAFTVVGIALYVLQRQEVIFFEKSQRAQTALFSKAQLDLSSEQEVAARNVLVAVHETGHVNLTRFFANMLWEKNIAPFMAKVQQLPDNHCRTLAIGEEAGRTSRVDARQACFAEIGRKIMALPGFASLDATAYAAMRTSTVFKIKVFDRRGITVYSSEHSQIGEDKAENLGWKTAVNGLPASELTHRDRFSAFEGVVENRDLISSYIPVRAFDKVDVIGVFEIYSDVTPFLKQIKGATTSSQEITAANLAKAERAAMLNQQKVDSSSDRFLMIVGGLLALLYAALLFLVRNGQRIIDEQSRAQEQSAWREQQWHREKMAALATMAANVSHELGNRLATISGLAEDIADRRDGAGCSTNQTKLILEETQRIAGMIRQIADFAAARSEKPELVDINQMAKAVCDFLGFDSRFHSTRIEFRPDNLLPACVVIPDHLNEVLINLLQACVESETKPAQILLETKSYGAGAQVCIVCEPSPANVVGSTRDSIPASMVESAQRRMVAMGGQLVSTEAGMEIILPGSEVPS